MAMILLLAAVAFGLLAVVRLIELVIRLIWPKAKPAILKGETTLYVQISPKASANSDKERLFSK